MIVPDYGFTYKGYRLYFTTKCVIEPMHTHVEMNYVQLKAAKIWVGSSGNTKVENPGQVPEKILKEMCDWIKDNHEVMKKKWDAYGGGGYYINIDKV